MTPEQKVVSLETAKRLKAQGFPQDAEHWWNLLVEDEDNDVIEWGLDDFNHGRGLAAPDAQEIGEEIKLKTLTRVFFTGLCFAERSDQKAWCVSLLDGNMTRIAEEAGEAEARAAAWLWLKENNLL